MTAYQPGQWHDMFVAMAGAAAALTGLIFVAVSINLEQVLKYPALPPRAVETLSILIGLLVLSVFVLIPGQSLTALGTEILVLGVVMGTALLVKRIRLPRAAGQPLTWTLTPAGVIATHRSLFDGSLQGLAFQERPVFGFQGHPEASPGPHDLRPLFERFNHLMLRRLQAQLKAAEENLRRQQAGGR